jgi:hypothetical protein
MKKTLKRLPVILALAATILVSACSEIEVNPRGDGDEEETPIIIKPKPLSTQAAADTVSIS